MFSVIQPKRAHSGSSRRVLFFRKICLISKRCSASKLFVVHDPNADERGDEHDRNADREQDEHQEILRNTLKHCNESGNINVDGEFPDEEIRDGLPGNPDTHTSKADYDHDDPAFVGTELQTDRDHYGNGDQKKGCDRKV